MQKRRNRNMLQRFFTTPQEDEIIKEKMLQAGIKNKSAYLRKAAIESRIIHHDFSAINDFIKELNRIGNNVNQLTRTANSYGLENIYVSDLQEIRKELNRLWQQLGSKV